MKNFIFPLLMTLSFWAFADERIQRPDLFPAPTTTDLQEEACGSNGLSSSENKIQEICWLVPKDFSDESLEALKVTWEDGVTKTFPLSAFVFNIRLSNLYGSQILKATIEYTEANKTHVSNVFKEFISDYGRTKSPYQILGTLPSGEKFILKIPNWSINL